MYINLSSSCFMVTLDSGNKAVYLAQPQHVGSRTLVISHGEQLAHELDGKWFKPGGWQEITDLRTIALLERCPEL